MKRLVYSPSVKAFISADTGVVDVSPYITSGSVNRKINQVSSAQLTLRNPVKAGTDRLIWTENLNADGSIGPMFHPMDPIIVILTRFANNPIQVFTGYLDKAPYFALYPGLCTVEASCTLKRLLYTQWDPSLPFTETFLQQFGWILNADNGIVSANAQEQSLKAQAGQIQGQFNDGSIGGLLFAVLNIIGQWDASTIWIEELPPEIKDIVTQLYQQEQGEVQQGDTLFKSLLTQILGTGSQGSSSNGTPGNLPANIDQGNWAEATLQGIGAPLSECNIKAMEAWAQQEGGLPNNNPLNTSLGLSAGNWHYPDIATGVKNTVSTLLEAHYSYIVDAFVANKGIGSIWRAINSGTPAGNGAGGSCWCCSGCGTDYPGTLHDLINSNCSTTPKSATPNTGNSGKAASTAPASGQSVAGHRH